MKFLYPIVFLLLHLLTPLGASAQKDSLGRVHTDMPTLNDQHYLTADIYYKGVTAKDARLYYRCFKYDSKGDSVLICRKDSKLITLNGDLEKQTILFTESDGPAYYLPVFYNILRRTGSTPAGPYKIYLTLKTDSTTIIQRSFIYPADSALSPTSPLRKELNQTLVPEKKAKVLGISFAKEAKTVNSLASNTAKTLDHAAGKIDRLFKSKGLTSTTTKRDGKDIISLYYEDWFVGRYEVELSQSLNGQVKKQQDALTQPVTSLVTNELEGYKSLLSQVKDLTKTRKEERELKGEIGLTGNWATSQDPYSNQDNNYYELRGNIETSLQDMPIDIEGFYQQYSYDADNRITQVRTSHDGIIWNRDAAYTYYKHGPLARVSLGEQRVQGIDYAYTLQGWLKTINGDAADTTIDPGGDGRKGTGITPKDIYATNIDYFNGDYTAIGGTNAKVTTLPQSLKSLYNGNIARQTTDVSPFGGLTTAYTYDQLNRIRFANYAKRNQSNALAFNTWYASSYKYDQDGNLLALTRNDQNGNAMDRFSYYYPHSGQDNKLANVLDSSSFSQPGVEDLPRHIPAVAGLERMQYDEDGNLITDKTSGTDTVKWNIYGKTTDLVNNTSKLNLHFVYDGAGQRVSKNQTIITDTGHINQNTYYVRDATGNILAEYNTKQVYANGGGRLQYTPLTGVVQDPKVLLHSIHELGYDLTDRFKASVLSQTSGQPVPYQPGYYLAKDPALFQKFLMNNSNTLLPALCNYSAGTRHYPAADAMMMVMRGGDDRQLSDLSNALFTQHDDALRNHILTQLAVNMPDLYQQIASMNGIDNVSTVDASTHLAKVMEQMCLENPSWYTEMIHQFYLKGVSMPDLPNPVLPWLQAVTSDDTYLHNDALPVADFMSTQQDNLLKYGYEAAKLECSINNDKDISAYGFFGFVNSQTGSTAMLNEITSADELQKVDYDAAPETYLNSLMVTNPTVVDAALDAMGSDVDAGNLYKSIVNNAMLKNIPVNDLPPVQYNGNDPVLKSQQITLASHHIYGSSRIGIAGYWPGQYARIWDNVARTVDTMRLSGNKPWYSNTYNDVIEAGYTSPSWSGSMGAIALAQNLSGQKQYELTNHLGNVQSTVSDRRFSKQGTGGLPLFSAGIVAAYDYYPFGMLMPGRNIADTDQHCALVSQVALAPQVTGTALQLSGASATHGATVISGPGGSIGARGQTGGLSFTINVVANTSVGVQVNLSALAGYTVVTVSEYVTTNGVSNWVVRGSQPVNYPFSPVNIAVTPTTSTLRITIEPNVSYPVIKDLFTVSSIQVQRTTLVPTNVVTTICNKASDKYEFGFNGQIKDNEVAGTGNHNTALFWEYDTRTARRWNLDPKPHNGISNYSTFGGNPIFNADPNGDYFTETQGGNGLKRLEMLKTKANDRIAKYKDELANGKPNAKRAEHLNALIGQTQGTLDHVAEMEKSNVEFHIGTGKEVTPWTVWNPEKMRVDVGSLGAGSNPDDLGVLPHELEHGYQYLSGDLAGYLGGASDPLYELSDEFHAAWQATLLSDKFDFNNWHSTDAGRSYDDYKATETGPKSGHPAVKNNTTAISVNTSASVVAGMKDNILAGSAYQVLKTNPKATVGDAINYYNTYQEAHKMPNRILTGKALENRK